MSTLALARPRSAPTFVERRLLAAAGMLTAYVEQRRSRRADLSSRDAYRATAADAQRARSALVHAGMLPR